MNATQTEGLPASTGTRHTTLPLLRGGGSFTSWSSWRSFTVTLLWSSGRAPLWNTPSRVITTGWRTLKSKATADTSEGASSEGSGTLTISISACRPDTGTGGGQRLLRRHASHSSPSHRAGHLSSGNEGRASRVDGGRSEKNLHHQHFEKDRFLGLPSSKRALARVCVCGFLITKEQFITQAIDEKIKAVKGKQAFYFICILHKFCGSLQK